MYLKAIIAYYHAVFLRPHMWTLLIWNFDLHVNVVNFHIIKIHESYTISRPASHICVSVCVYKPKCECMHACLYMHMQIQIYIYVCVCMWECTVCECIYAGLCVRVCVGFGVEIMHWGLMCNYWHILGISERSDKHGRQGDEIWGDKKEKHINIASVCVCAFFRKAARASLMAARDAGKGPDDAA